MEKFKNYLLLCVLTLGMGFAFTACGDDDDEPGNKSDLTGTWVQTEFYECEKEDGEIVHESNTPYTDARVEFKDNGVINLYFSLSGSWQVDDSGKWWMSGNNIYVRWEGDDEDEYFGSVLTLNSTTLTVEAKEDYTEDGVRYEYYEKATYKKIN